jgi:23S rRNA (cytosine1962-C5)-methyltransferase
MPSAPANPTPSSPSSPSTYALLDAGRGERLEQWGPYRLRRPDARATMGRALPDEVWSRIDAHYRGEAGHGGWDRLGEVPERWTIEHAGLTLVVKLAPFKHTGVFPEQADHWRWLTEVGARAGRRLAVLNLFAYTGGATMTLAKAGHQVTHVDASKPALAWARENAAANALPADAIRWIQDDAATFVRRELRRGRHYDAAILDPPAFGRTPDGGIWRLRDHLPALLGDVASLLPDPVFLLLNDYSQDAERDQLATLVRAAFTNTALARETPTASPHGSRAATSHAGAQDFAAGLEAGHLHLPLPAWRSLDTGTFVRWSITSP